MSRIWGYSCSLCPQRPGIIAQSGCPVARVDGEKRLDAMLRRAAFVDSIAHMQEIRPLLEQIVGPHNLLSAAAWNARGVAWETHQPCNAWAVIRPSNTKQVARIMQVCHEFGQSVVPYGGLTNLVKGCASTGSDLALSFEIMNQIEDIDVTASTMTVQAGVTMQAVQERALQENLYFPVDIGARGTCMVGGNVSTNAGGTKVIRHGMIRDSVLGLEVVMADGTIIESMNHFLKNNSGFDLKQLFIGTEGVLGLITRIIFRLETLPTTHNVALVACENYDQVLAVLQKARQSLGSSLCGFEVMWDNFFGQVVKPVGKHASPVAAGHAFNIIIESMGSQPGADDDTFENFLTDSFESQLITDGAIAKSGSERDGIWAIRHEVEWVVRDAFIFDVSLPIASVSDYVNTITRKISAEINDARIAAFGHLGDNNIHISVLSDSKTAATARLVEKCVYESLIPYRGAISAEHGIGLEKKDYLPISRTSAEIELMRVLKRSLDPKNILNPGKVISPG
ncbi:MAG: FAD-binding oxidoreductase [Proteobacteria bacterium]|nr:FAD-binding oxidoreductase [Pseudomonadota bacterium]